MKSNYEQSKEGLRTEIRSKRRKTNLILNGLIGLVLLLIIIVSVSIFSNDEGQGTPTDKASENKAVETKQEATKNADSQKQSKTSETDANKNKTDDDAESERDAKTEDNKDGIEITEGGGDNVKRTIVNSEWEPVGTTQTGPNTSEQVDWDERVSALAYAIDADESNMTVWYLSRDGQNKAIGTVTVKGNPQAYRVYLEWRDEGGWMPVKVEELIENDKG